MSFPFVSKTLRRKFPGDVVASRICTSLGRPARIENVLPPLESFSRRHIGPSDSEMTEMLKVCNVKVSYDNY